MIGVPSARSRVERAVQQVAQGATDQILLGGRIIRIGSGDPNTVVAGNPGDIYVNEDGGDGTTFYVAESAGTEWRAMQGSEVLGALMTLDQGVIVADIPVTQTTSTWNNAAVMFRGWVASFIETAKAVTSRYVDIKGGATGTEERFSIDQAGIKVSGGTGVAALNQLISYGQLGVQGIIRRNGTHAAPTGVLAGEQIGQYDFRPRRDTGAEQATALLVATALEVMTNVARGTRFDLESTALGATARTKTLSLEGNETRSNGRYVSETDKTFLKIAHAQVAVPAVAGATITAANLIPKGAVVVGVSTRVTTALGATSGTTGYRVGDGVDPDRWGVAVGVALATKTRNADWTADIAPPIFLAAQSVVITADGGNFDGTGSVWVDVAYLAGDAA